MKKRLFAALMAACVILTATGPVFADEEIDVEARLADSEEFAANYDAPFVYDTKAIEDYKKTPATAQGTVETLEYDTPAYAINDIMGVEETIHKSVNVYLPNGYDPGQQYNILYLMHGGGDDQDYWLIERERCHGEVTCNVLDHMIEDGLCDPVIVVTPTFYANVEGVEPSQEEISAKIEELGEDNFGRLEDLYTWYFRYELRNEIIPLVESTYSTYAAGDTSEENLIATRDHRAYAGLSMGSITSAHSILMANVDIISYVGSFSGIKTNIDLLKDALENTFADYPIHYWYNGEGVQDIAYEEHVQLYRDAMEQMPGKFTDGENAVMVILTDGSHAWMSWIVELYNVMQVFFK